MLLKINEMERNGEIFERIIDLFFFVELFTNFFLLDGNSFINMSRNVYL